MFVFTAKILYIIVPATCACDHEYVLLDLAVANLLVHVDGLMH